jgi:hypothetical protein
VASLELAHLRPVLSYFSEVLCRIDGFVHFLNTRSEKGQTFAKAKAKAKAKGGKGARLAGRSGGQRNKSCHRQGRRGVN